MTLHQGRSIPTSEENKVAGKGGGCAGGNQPSASSVRVGQTNHEGLIWVVLSSQPQKDSSGQVTPTSNGAAEDFQGD